MNCLLRSACIAFLALTITDSKKLCAQEILGLDLGGNLYSIDHLQGGTTFIGSAGLTPHFWSAMAIDSQGRLFAAYGRYFSAYEIYEINPQTGQASFFAQTDLFGISGLAFDDNDVLFALNDRTAPSGVRPMDLFTIDIQTGSTTFIGDTGIHNALTLDFHDGFLWTHNTYNGIHLIDRGTGIATDIHQGYTGPPTSTISICFNEAGALFFVEGILWMVDPTTGVFSLIDYVSPFNYWAEIVFVEGPRDAFSLWLAGTSNGPVGVRMTGATPGGQVAIGWAQGPGGPTIIPAGFPCAGIEMDLAANMRLAGVVTADSNGEVMFGPQFMPASAIQNIRIQAIDLNTCATSNRVIVAH